jgi:hypothetical protein
MPGAERQQNLPANTRCTEICGQAQRPHGRPAAVVAEGGRGRSGRVASARSLAET